MEPLTSTEGQADLPRYFRQVFDQASRINNGRIVFVLPDGRRFVAQGPGPGPVGEIVVHDPDTFARLIREGDLGFLEAYMDGWWSTPDLQAFMDMVSLDNDPVYRGFSGLALIRVYERLHHWLRGNSRAQARRNIARHYDLGNDFYALWLDASMTYSSALFRTGQESLERAQEQKYAALVDALEVPEGAHVVEIGCGWGGFAEYAAARRGLRVTGITISRAQYDFAQARVQRAGLADRVAIELRDYRDLRGRFDGLASIEMIEAVGERYWPAYFRAIHDRLAPGARAVIQAITVPDARFEGYRRNVDFIQKHIFPGGMLIAPGRLADEAARAGLARLGALDFGESYSQTLRRWHETFAQHWGRIEALGYDLRFRRMWELYLTSCAAAFRTGICDVSQFTLRRPA